MIQTELGENDGPVWSRLRVTFEYHHGVHNDSKEGPADLCQECAVKLLTDALKRVKAGERLSAGVENIDKTGFNKIF